MEHNDEHYPLTPVEQFGIDLRELRVTRKMTVRGLGSAVGCSGAYVSKVENAKLAPSEKFAMGCDRVFGTGTMLTRQRQRAIDGDDPTWFEPYTNKERKAAGIFTYSTLFVPGLFQTPEYARAVYRAGAPRLSASALEARLKARMRRQEVLRRDSPPDMWMVLCEASLRTVAGSREVMARQLEHLMSVTEAPNITFQLIPFGVVPASAAAFTLLTFERAPTVLHVEGPQGGRPIEAAQVVKTALATFDRSRAEALGQDASIARFREIHKEYTL
ncbi:helix-turn-helix transcriptional regulator [Streptomyces sp. NPDC006798]|uniref:helix-turn-helix domain-containing protein n=1 Tax=Streptomyces sp. NPDC006798 TaxID=3155462 RepID=UPI0033DA22EB